MQDVTAEGPGKGVQWCGGCEDSMPTRSVWNGTCGGSRCTV